MNEHLDHVSLLPRPLVAVVAEPVPVVSTRWLFGRYDYPLSHRILELGSLAAFVALAAAMATQVVPSIGDRRTGWTVALVAAALMLGCALADLLSGVVHFIFDQYGTPTTPVIGQKFVKPFRDHHVDPLAMTHGDFIAVNSDNLLISLPVMGLALAFVDLSTHPYIGVFVLALVLAAGITNQIHKWAHMPDVSRPVRFAQRRGLILGVEHHNCHHRAPHDRHYCITFGRLDVVLDVMTTRLSCGSADRTGTAHPHQPRCTEDRLGRQTDHHAT